VKRFTRDNRYRALVTAAILAGVAAVWGVGTEFHKPVHASVPDISSRNAFLPTIQNQTPAPGNPPAGMNWIPGGEFSMGAKDPTALPEGGHEAMEDARPIHRVYVDGFWMDKTDVTNAQFERFVKATGYITVAERQPLAKDFPGVPAEKLVAGSLVFTPPANPVSLDDYSGWWSYVAGANWRHPLGPKSNILGRANYPVVQIAYEDAVAYSKWAGKRLPTEQSGSLRREADLTGSPTPGATACVQTASGWPIRTKAIFLTPTAPRMDTRGSRRSLNFRQMGTACMTLQGTYGSGPRIFIVPTTMPS
jgi:formylglycine-generating enzyme required for sulfatase activity